MYVYCVMLPVMGNWNRRLRSAMKHVSVHSENISLQCLNHLSMYAQLGHCVSRGLVQKVYNVFGGLHTHWLYTPEKSTPRL